MPVDFFLLLSQPNMILLEDGVIGAEGALCYANMEARVVDYNVVRRVPLLLRDHHGYAGVAATSFAISTPVVVTAPSVATLRKFGSGHRVDGRDLVAR
jgi:hypothetical protein